MKKLIFLSLLACLLALPNTVLAQVTIGSNADPNPNAVLDLISQNNKGLLLPRVALTATNSPAPLSTNVPGMTVYNTATASANTAYYVSPGLYYNDGNKWVRLPMGATNWFYMPSVSFSTATVGVARTQDLYALYAGQFTSPMAKSTSAPSAVPYIPAKEELYYYVTYYDPAVFANVSIDDNGVMTYDVIATPTVCSYINIIFVLK